MSSLPFPVSYMGSKRSLAPLIGDYINSQFSQSTVLDAFCGMGAITSVVATKHQVWASDIDSFPTAVHEAHLKSRERKLTPDELVNRIGYFYDLAHKDILANAHVANALEIESNALASAKVKDINNSDGRCRTLWTHYRRGSADTTDSFFTHTYAGTYFGLHQCIDVDALRCAILHCRKSRTLSLEAARWALLALCKAANHVSTAPGHFAQYLTVNERNAGRFVRERNTSIFDQWLSGYSLLNPSGTTRWRRTNRVYQSDAIDLLNKIVSGNTSDRPDVVFADPPYTKDQYSRYYHMYETLIRGDSPHVSGKGRCRSLPLRSTSNFCRATQVASSFESLIEKTARAGSALILSYREDGILPNSLQTIHRMTRRHFRCVDIFYHADRPRSTHGASHGCANTIGTDFVIAAW